MGFLEATVDIALKRPELRDGLMEYLKTKVNVNDNIEEVSVMDEVAIAE